MKLMMVSFEIWEKRVEVQKGKGELDRRTVYATL
jgi:hypothetical protein